MAGLVCWGAQLNPQLPDISAQPCGVLDAQVIPNWDPSHGNTEEVTEQEFLQTLEVALKQHGDRVKVWNLSLGTSEVCSLDDFSAFAEQLDNLQEQYLVSFVISAGNYDTVPLLTFPADWCAVGIRSDNVPCRQCGSGNHCRSHPPTLTYQANGPNSMQPRLPFPGMGRDQNYCHQAGSCA